ncbi:MAG TPA: NAD(P)H-dependent glycerol-3-phosphate dehydrogenase [Candidatus Hypogeohydataceae bacterium YC40]
MKPVKKIAVLGSGGWGTALALLLYKKGLDVLLWGNSKEYIEFLKEKRKNVKYLPGVILPKGLVLTSDLEAASKGRELFVVAVPTPYLRAVMERFKPYYVSGVPLLSGAKGIENDTLLMASQVILDVLENSPMSLLLGPSHAEEVARNLPTTVVASSREQALAKEIQRVFTTEQFRVYTNPDVVGVEVGAAVKNVIAIAAGICDGLGFGDNTKAALITRGLVEIARLGVKIGAQRATFSGLTGLGDLITTCVSKYGRNRFVGEQIGKGRKLKNILKRMEQVAEGIYTTRSVKLLAKKYKVEMPISSEIYRILYEDKDPRQAVSDLMMRSPRAEMEELE